MQPQQPSSREQLTSVASHPRPAARDAALSLHRCWLLFVLAAEREGAFKEGAMFLAVRQLARGVLQILLIATIVVKVFDCAWLLTSGAVCP